MVCTVSTVLYPYNGAMSFMMQSRSMRKFVIGSRELTLNHWANAAHSYG